MKVTTQWFLSAVMSTGLAIATPMTAPGQVTPTTPQPSPVMQARKEISDARVGVVKSKQDLEKARARLEAGFGAQNPAYAAAQKASQKAQMDVKMATAAALARLEKNPDYVEAVKAKQAAKDKQAALQADSKASSDDLQSAFNDVLARAKTVTEMESGATQSDPKIADAKQRSADAKQQLDDFKAQIDTACAADPEYQQAQQAETTAAQRLAQAEQAYAQQAKQQADAQAAAAKSKGTSPKPPAGIGR